MPNVFACFILLFGVFCSQAAFAQVEHIYQSLDVTDPNTLGFAPDPRFDAPDQGTVEIVLAVAPQQAKLPITEDLDDSSACIVEHGQGRDVNWRLKLWSSEELDILRFGRPDGGQVELRMPLRGTGYHRILFVTSGGRTQAIVDGKLFGEQSGDGATPGPGVKFSYLPGTPEGRSLTFGCSNGPTAKVWISTLRLWDTALTVDDAALLAESRGPVGSPADIADHLLAFSVFTNRKQEMRFTGERILFSEFKGAGGGKPFFFKRPRGQELYGVYAKIKDDKLNDFTVEYDIAARFGALTNGNNWAGLSLPTVLPRRTNVEDGERAAWVMRQITAKGRFGPTIQPGSSAVEDFALLKDLLVRYREAERKKAFGLQESKMVDANNFTEDGIEGYGAPLVSFYRYKDVIASYGSDGIRGFQWGMDGPNWSEFTGAIKGRLNAFSLEIPDGARLEGIAGRQDDTGSLRALSFAYSLDTRPEKLADRLTRGVWVSADATTPVREPAKSKEYETSSLDGTYSDQTVYRFTEDHGGQQLVLHIDKSLDGILDSPNKLIERIYFDPLDGNEWHGQTRNKGERDRLVFESERILWSGRNDENGKGIILVRPLAYELADDNKLPWGATFSLDHRPNGVIASFKGYNPEKMRARDYQATTGTGKFLFELPDDNSTDYTTNGSRVIVPHGFSFSLDSKGSERADANKMETSEERQSSWTVGLGGKVGIPLIASFEADGSHQQSQETIDTAGLSMQQNRAIVTHYAFVADKSRIRLSSAFRDRVIALRDRQVAGFPVDYEAFFDNFGTNYPYAVTYGGMAWSETTVCSNETTTGSSTDDKIKASASGILEDVLEVGINANSEYSSGSKSVAGSTQDRTNYGTYGGSFSKGGGWSVGRGEELPTLLDLRPVTELLSPLFFDDRRIYEDLRLEMQKALQAHSRRLENKARTWNFEAKLKVPAKIDAICKKPVPESCGSDANPCVATDDEPINPGGL